MTGELDSKVALVTGATSGIGLATARLFAREGARLVIVGRNEEALSTVSQQLSNTGRHVLKVVADLIQPDAIANLIRKTIEQFNGLHILVNAAGHISSGAIEDTSLAAWDAMLAVNLRSVFLLMQAAMPSLAKTR